MIALLALGVAQADPLVDALADELERSMGELELGESGAPYFVGYDLMDITYTDMDAVLGSVVQRSLVPKRKLGVSVRVGSALLDSANFQMTWRAQDGHRSRNTVLGDDGLSLRHTAWFETDAAYKDAIENLSRRVAARARSATGGEEAPCFGPGPVQTSTSEAVSPVPFGDLEPIAVPLSAVFLDYPEIEWSRVYTGAENGRRILVDSLGTRVIKPEVEVNVKVVARVRALDGSHATDQVSWSVSDLKTLPPLEEMVAETTRMAERLKAWKMSEIADEDYVGPVIFEGEAAVELTRKVIVPALVGTPPPEKPPSGSRTFLLPGNNNGTTMRVKRRLMPAGFHVRDDPGADPTLPSSFRFDDEGEAAKKLDLVVDGVIRTHYTSRTPSKEVTVSNGHGRGNPGKLKRGAPSITTVEVDRGLSSKKLHRLAIAQAAAYELDHYLVVRRLEDSAAAGASRLLIQVGGEKAGPLAQPIVAVKVFADGHEEAFRGYGFVGVDNRSLRDLVAGGSRSTTRTVRYAGSGTTGSTPVTLTAPDLLFSEMELTAGGDGGEKPPALPSPLASMQ